MNFNLIACAMTVDEMTKLDAGLTPAIEKTWTLPKNEFLVFNKKNQALTALGVSQEEADKLLAEHGGSASAAYATLIQQGWAPAHQPHDDY